jgi:polyisoprenoid-binding protein YceI
MSAAPLIDILSAESYAAEHLPGAVNFCVYETAFIDKIQEAFPDPAVSLTVYGCNDSTGEAQLAVEKLNAAGYSNIQVLAGGIEGWKSAGKEVSGNGPSGFTSSGRYAIDPEASQLQWVGQNLLNQHRGTLKLKEGWVDIQESRLQGGEFMVDMQSLVCADLEDSKLNQMLVAHLRSADFFEAEEYPTAHFVIAFAEPLEAAGAGVPNYKIRGNLTLRGQTHELEFLAITGRTAEGAFVAQARLDLDRTRWGSVYGSGKFFARLGQHLVNDLVYLHLKVVTQKDAT